MNWWDKFFQKKLNVTYFDRIQIQEISAGREYHIYSEDGDPDSHITLRLDSLEYVLAQIRNEILENPGNIERFKTLYADYFFISFWQVRSYGCDRRLSLYRTTRGDNKLAWILDFQAPNIQDSRLLKALFKQIASLQFVEDSDWYHYILTLNWESFFVEAIGQHHLAFVKAIKRSLIRKKEINEAMQLHWKRAGLGEVPPPLINSSENSPPLRIPYEEIAKMVLDRRNSQ